METPPRMTARHPAPAPTPEIELSPYPSHNEFQSQSASHPLLPHPSGSSRGSRTTNGLGFEYDRDAQEQSLNLDEDTGPAGIHRPGGRYPKNSLRRYWKPLLFISLPFALVFIYSLVHPHVPGLPALPKVKVHIGTEDSVSSGAGAGAGVAGLGGDAGCEEYGCICGSTDEGRRLCEVYRREGLAKSQLVKGSGARVRRVLHKARDGERIKVGILGGSVSACHGLHPNPEFPQGDPTGPGCYTTLLEKWFKSAFPETSHEFMNGAIGGMDSSYYAFCGTHHIALDTDLIVLEFDVNDQTDNIYQAFFDQLLRVLSSFQSQPAIVILGAWSPQVAQDVGYADPQVVHLPIAHYYDIPYISMKRMVFDHYLRYPESMAKAFYQPDMLHPNARGHRILADLVIAYLEYELCQVTRYGLPVVPASSDTISSIDPFSSYVDVPFPLDTLHLVDPFTAPENWESSFDLKPLDSLRTENRHFVLPQTPYSISPVSIFTPLRDVVDPKKPDPNTAEGVLGILQPEMFCADANDHEHPMAPVDREGWEPFVWNGEKHFWVSETVGARIKVDIKVKAGRVAVYYYRSQHYNLGDAKCWVDDNESGAVNLSGYWTKQYNVAVVAYIDEKVTMGDHYVTCEVSQNTSHPHNPDAHNFRIVAVMAT